MNDLLEKCLITKEHIDNMNHIPKKKNKNLGDLLGKQITQSQSVKFGKIFESFIKNILIQLDINVFNVNLIEMNIEKNKKDVDLLFELGDTIYYFELKCNLNLDSEKFKVTDDKIQKIKYQLHQQYNKPVEGYCMTCWYDDSNIVNKLKSQIFFMKDFFELINLDISEETYYNTLKNFGKYIE